MLTNLEVREVEYRVYPMTLTGDPREVKVSEGTEIAREIPVCVAHQKPPKIVGDKKVVVQRV